ncbi:hypothetical protein DPMN_137192 [Dreissena polymorpha]|uniref:Uncharacterized protein n=1 Tax=Dreissena polymorpha TaxID=45954 RepID=A0A9D4JHF8_DREPO|nr:hypothetical protein DPMN_137192 [Dreissena polymorpha]
MYRRSSRSLAAAKREDANDSPLEDMTVTVVQNLAQPEFHQHSDMHTTSKTYQGDNEKQFGLNGNNPLFLPHLNNLTVCDDEYALSCISQCVDLELLQFRLKST